MDGWIKLHREIVDHWIYQDAEYLKVWLEMLVRARYWDESGTELVGDQLVKVDRGEFIFGRPKWSKRLGISEQRLKTLIQKMIKDEMIEVVQKFPRCTLYRIKNYEKFNQQDNQQSNQQESQQQQGMQDDSNQQYNQQSNQQPTSTQPAPNQQPTNNKERKNIKNDKKERNKDNTAFEAYTSNPILIETLEAFVDHRKKMKKPLTDRAIQLLLGNLDKLANSDDEKVAILNQSILNGWQGIFPLKENSGKRSRQQAPAKPQVPIIERTTETQPVPVSDEEMAELMKMAQEMQAKKGGNKIASRGNRERREQGLG